MGTAITAQEHAKLIRDAMDGIIEPPDCFTSTVSAGTHNAGLVANPRCPECQTRVPSNQTSTYLSGWSLDAQRSAPPPSRSPSQISPSRLVFWELHMPRAAVAAFKMYWTDRHSCPVLAWPVPILPMSLTRFVR